MPRHARCAISNIPYHIVHRGNNHQPIFKQDMDYHYFLGLVQDAKEKYPIKLYSYVLMSNHIHMLLESHADGALPAFVKHIAQKYAQYVNRAFGRSGTLWEGRYKSSAVASDYYLLACSRYIEMNPVRARIADDPAQYPWSSFRGKTGLKQDRILDYDVWYSSLGENEEQRHKRYSRWFRESIPSYEWKLIKESANQGTVFGDALFTKQMEDETGRKLVLRYRGRPRKNGADYSIFHADSTAISFKNARG